MKKIIVLCLFVMVLEGCNLYNEQQYVINNTGESITLPNKVILANTDGVYVGEDTLKDICALWNTTQNRGAVIIQSKKIKIVIILHPL